MRALVSLLSLVLISACGAAGDAERLLLPGQWRDATPEERSYAYLAWDLRSDALCGRISPRALVWHGDEPQQLRSRCLTGVAANLRDPAPCHQVVSVRTLLYDGAAYGAGRCRTRAADPRGVMVGPIADPRALLEQLGFDATALRAQCQAAVERSLGWRQGFARSIERCVEGSSLEACRAHALRLATSVYFRDADAPCLALWSVDPVTIAPVARPGEPAHDWAAWYKSKLRSGALPERVDRLRDFSQG